MVDPRRLSKCPLPDQRHQLSCIPYSTLVASGILLAFIAITLAPTLLALAFSNSAMIVLNNGLSLLARPMSDRFPYNGFLASKPDGLLAASLSRHAVALAPQNVVVTWVADRVCIVALDCSALPYRGQDVLEGIAFNPLMFETQLMRLSLHGAPESVLALYGRLKPSWERKAINDTVALAYLDLAQPFVDEDNQAGAYYLRQALVYRPFDLYANLALANWAEQNGDLQAATAYRSRYLRFPVEAVVPSNQRLMEYISEAIAKLTREEIWTDEQAVNVISFMLWQAATVESVRLLVEEILSTRSERTEWLALREELHMRLGTTTPLSIQGSSYASDKSGQAQNLFGPHLSDVAELFGIPLESQVMGQNLLPQGDFEKYYSGTLSGWAVADYATGKLGDGPHAAVAAGIDTLAVSGALSARIQGLWLDDPIGSRFFGLVSQDEGRHGSYAVRVEPHRPYLVSGMYRTAGAQVRPEIYLGNPDFRLLDHVLAPAEGAWKSFSLIGCHSAESAQQMQLLLRLRSPGTVWFDRIQVRPVTAGFAASLCERILSSE